MQMDTSQDVIVVGGGLAGAVAALCLGRMGMKVTILEKFKVPRRKIGETLPPEASRFFDSSGLNNWFDGGKHIRSYGVVSSWG